jgi:hypothetical protein
MQMNCRLQLWGSSDQTAAIIALYALTIMIRRGNHFDKCPLLTDNAAFSECIVRFSMIRQQQLNHIDLVLFSPDLISRLRNTGVFASSPHGVPNHIILNEVSARMLLPSNFTLNHTTQYLPGQGIMVCSSISIRVLAGNSKSFGMISHTRTDRLITL